MLTDTFEVEIAAIRREADGIVGLDLVRPDGAPLPRFEAGAHVEVHIGPSLVRQYSICNNPEETHRYRLAILLESKSRGGSAAMHRDFAKGTRLLLTIPRNNFRLVESAKRSILLAGGIGVTPLLAMAYRLEATGRDFCLHYCARTQKNAAFVDLLTTSSFADKVAFHFDDGPDEQRLPLDVLLTATDPGVHIYICGPAGFMDFVKVAANRHQWPDSQVHTEYFNAIIDITGNQFDVKAARSGVTVRVESKESIVDALRRVAIEVNVSCEQGVCGTCLTRVLQGIPDHRDLFQTDEEKSANSHMTLCCSRALTPEIVLDI